MTASLASLAVGRDRIWLSKWQTAELIGCSLRSVERKAIAYGARRSDERSRNGSTYLEFPLDGLPEAAQRRYWTENRVVQIPSEELPKPSIGQMVLDLTTTLGPRIGSEAEQDEAKKRWAIIEKIVACKRGKREPVVRLMARVSGKSPRTIRNWVDRFEGRYYPGVSGLEALIDQPRADKGKGRVVNNAAKDLIVRLMVPGREDGILTIRQAYEAYKEHREQRAKLAGKVLDDETAARLKNYVCDDGRLKPDAQLPEVSYETFRSYVRQIPEPLLVMARGGEEEFDKTQAPLSYRNYESIPPLDYVVMDHRQLDLFCILPDSQRKNGYKLGRPWLTAAMDMRTRKWLGWALVPTPNSDSIATVLMQVLRQHGRPKSFYWDNGQDFECDWLDGVLTALGVHVTHSLVRNARAKNIEPNFKRLAAFERSLPWWCGHTPEARPERLEERLKDHEKWEHGQADKPAFPWVDELAKIVSDILEDLNRRPHTGTGMVERTATGVRRLSPNEAWEKLIGGTVREKVRWETLQFLFRERRQIKVRHDAVRLTFHGIPFIYRPGGDFDPLALSPLNGQVVEVAVNKLDLQSVAVFFRGQMVCLAENVALRGMREEAFKSDARLRRRQRRWFREMMHCCIEEVSVDGALERLQRRQEAAAAGELAEPGGEVTVMYPEAERAVAALAAGGCGGRPVQPARLEFVETTSRDDGGFDFFSGGDE